MAPKKGSKRAAEATIEADDAKRLQTVLKQKGVTKSTFEALVEAIQHPMANLNGETRKMLIAMLPHGLLAPREERSEAQECCVRMLGDVFENIASAMKAEIAEAEDVLGKETAQATKLSEDATQAEAALTVASEAAAAKKMALAEAARGVIDSKANLAQKEKEQQAGNAAYAAAMTEKEDLETALAHDFRLVRDGDGEASPDTSKLLSLSAKLAFEESLLSALPSVLTKKPAERGSFDAMVVNQLEEGLMKKVAQLKDMISAGAPAAAARDAAVEEAKRGMDAAKDAQHLAADELTAANTDQQKCTAESETVKSAVVDQGPVVKAAADAKAEKEEQLQNFIDWNLACFETLRDRESLAPKKKAASIATDAGEVSAMEVAEAGA